MKVIICGGGTLGHVTPGISIAETIKEHHPNAEILFIGREGGEENQMIKASHFPLKTIKISGLKRKIAFENVKLANTLFCALKESKKIITSFGADLVIGTGGYVCWPVIKAAQKLKIPTVIHESNSVGGLATKLLAPKCQLVLVNFPGSEQSFKGCKNVCTVGNPIRKVFLTRTRDEARRKLGLRNSDFFILSLGGSGGSKAINEAVIKVMKNHSAHAPKTKHVHVTGKRYYDDIKKEEPELCRGYAGCVIVPFIKDISTYIFASDVIICRCGAVTLTEVAYAKVPAILIPSPNVSAEHQLKNATLFSERGAAILLREDELSESNLENAIKKLEKNTELRAKMSEKVSEFFTPKSNELIYAKIRDFLQK